MRPSSHINPANDVDELDESDCQCHAVKGQSPNFSLAVTRKNEQTVFCSDDVGVMPVDHDIRPCSMPCSVLKMGEQVRQEKKIGKWGRTRIVQFSDSPAAGADKGMLIMAPGLPASARTFCDTSSRAFEPSGKAIN